jgi:ribose 5-phosphate isomerase A
VTISGAYEFSPARTAAASAALELIEPGMTIGLGSGRAVWTLIEAIGGRWVKPPVKAVVASRATYALAQLGRIEVTQLDGDTHPDLAIDGADEVDPDLRLLKGGGGALLREKIVISAAHRFVVVGEVDKRVERLGQRFTLPVEVVRFGWRDTQRRVAAHLPESSLRMEGGDAYLTDENHFILDCTLPVDADIERLDREIKQLPGVVEHGLFIGLAERALLGRPDGEVEVITADSPQPPAAPPAGGPPAAAPAGAPPGRSSPRR